MTDVEYNQIFSLFEGEEGDLIPVLQLVQEQQGYISEESIQAISYFLKISQNQIYGVASFYSQFRFIEPGRNSIRVCMGTACHVRGGQVLADAVERELGITHGQTTEDKRFDFQRIACLGCCALAPVVQINDQVYSQMTVTRLKGILDQYE